MLEKVITYTDYDGNSRTETFHFNLTKAELTIMEMSKLGGFKKKMERIIEAQDGPSIMNAFRDIIRRSYGVKSDDGRRFIKSEELSDEFEQTEAYSVLFMELFTDPEAGANFIAGVLPPEVAKEMNSDVPTDAAIGSPVAVVK